MLLAAYLVAQLLALIALCQLDISPWATLIGSASCLAHAVWVLPRSILLNHPAAYRALKRDRQGWQLWSERGGWQPVCLRPDSLALPWVVMVRFRLVDGDGRPSGFDQQLLYTSRCADAGHASTPARASEIQPA